MIQKQFNPIQCGARIFYRDPGIIVRGRAVSWERESTGRKLLITMTPLACNKCTVILVSRIIGLRREKEINLLQLHQMKLFPFFIIIAILDLLLYVEIFRKISLSLSLDSGLI